MEAPDFWDNPEKSQESMKTLKSLKDDLETYNHLKEQYEEIELLIEMGYEENDESVLPEIEETLGQFRETFEAIRIRTLLSGEYDKNNAIVTLHAGAGGDRVPATGRPCFTGCIPDGQIKRLPGGSAGLSGRRGSGH